MNIDYKNDSVGDIVSKNYRTAQVFKGYHIDFCCGGGKTLDQVCKEKQVNAEKLQQDLELILNQSNSSDMPDFGKWPLDLLVDYIEKKHHRYVESTMPVLNGYLKKLAAVHGLDAPYLFEIAAIFKTSSENLAQHMKKEELILFPYVRRMEDAQRNRERLVAPAFGSIENPIRSMEEEHENEGDHFRQIEELSNGYEIPKWGCNTYVVAMNLLKEYQDDLHLHIHIENNILFPKAILLEQSLNRSNG